MTAQIRAAVTACVLGACGALAVVPKVAEAAFSDSCTPVQGAQQQTGGASVNAPDLASVSVSVTADCRLQATYTLTDGRTALTSGEQLVAFLEDRGAPPLQDGQLFGPWADASVSVMGPGNGVMIARTTPAHDRLVPGREVVTPGHSLGFDVALRDVGIDHDVTLNLVPTSLRASGGSIAGQDELPTVTLAIHGVFTTVAAPSACVVPRLAGQTVSSAQRRLAAAHCVVGHIVRRRSRVRRGRILRTDPPAGTRAADGASVDLVVSRGRR